ncbi:MAG: 16S rRNA (guanine(527)-N(7))-methyltransferase RsmG [Bacteroidota bacterium]
MNIEQLFTHFSNLSDRQKSQLTDLEPIYREWNERINVISRKDIENLYERHVLHSLGIAKVVDWTAGTQVLDVGTGGGFPGIPLAILFPQVEFRLIDSIGKKIKVVEAVAEALDLQNIEAVQQRGEKVKTQFDFVVARAVTRMQPFYQWIKKKIRAGNASSLPNGVLYLKGGDLDQELRELETNFRLFDLYEHFQYPFFETKKVVFVPTEA